MDIKQIGQIWRRNSRILYVMHGGKCVWIPKRIQNIEAYIHSSGPGLVFKDGDMYLGGVETLLLMSHLKSVTLTYDEEAFETYFQSIYIEETYKDETRNRRVTCAWRGDGVGGTGHSKAGVTRQTRGFRFDRPLDVVGVVLRAPFKTELTPAQKLIGRDKLNFRAEMEFHDLVPEFATKSITLEKR